MTTLTSNDRSEIEELLHRYWKTVDEGDLQGFAQTFTENGVLENYTGQTTGRPALEKWLQDYEPSRIGNRHSTVNTIMTPQNDGSVSVWSYMVVYAVTQPRQQTPHVAAFGRFQDVVVQQNGQWLFQHRLMDDLAMNKIDYPDQ